MILAGAYQSYPTLTLISVSGVILGAVYMLTLYMKTMFGEFSEERNGDLSDVNGRELATLLPLFVLVFLMGVYPKPFLDLIEPTIKDYVSAQQMRLVNPAGEDDDSENLNYAGLGGSSVDEVMKEHVREVRIITSQEPHDAQLLNERMQLTRNGVSVTINGEEAQGVVR